MKNLISIIAVFVSFLFLFCTQATIEIKGTVTDASNSPVSGVTITEKNKSNTTTTDASGNYTIKVVDKKSVLVFSKTGFASKEVTVGNSKKINVILTEEIVVVEDEVEEEMVIEREISISKDRKRISSAYSLSKQSKGMVATSPSVSYDQPYVDHNTESYDKITENKFLPTISNPVSTFSADVDRAAYANIRRYLNGSQLPPQDAVRIEEMINYFDYNYPQPQGKDPFSVNLEMGKCSWNEKHILLRIGIKGKDLNVSNLAPSNIVFLMDVSGSMNDPNKLPLLKQSFKILLEKLRPEDRVAMVVYAGAAGVVLPSTSCKDKDKILAALEKLEAGGSTAGGEGIRLAYKIAKENFIAQGNNRIILATDGDFNIGESSDAAMERLIEEKRKDGIFLTVLGFGMGNYKDSKMEKLSNAGNGNYAYIDNILEAKKTLGKEIWGTLYTIAKDVKIQIEFNPAKVKGYRLIGYENRMLNKEDFNDDTKDAGDIGAGHTVTAFYEIIPAGSDEKVGDNDDLNYQSTTLKKSNDLMTLKLRYKKPDEDVSNLISNKIEEKDIKSTNLSQDFLFASSVVEFGLLLRKSDFKANASYDHVIATAKQSKGQDDEGYRSEFIRLVDIAKTLAK